MLSTSNAVGNDSTGPERQSSEGNKQWNSRNWGQLCLKGAFTKGLQARRVGPTICV